MGVFVFTLSIFRPSLTNLFIQRRIMNIDELLKLPMAEPIIGGGPPTPLTVVDRKDAKKQPIHNRIVLVDRKVEPAMQKIASLQNLASSGMQPENVLAISGLATLEIMKNPGMQTSLSKYLFLIPMGLAYKNLDQIVTVQLLFIIVFQQLYYILKLEDVKDMPLLSESFEKRYTKVRELLSKETNTATGTIFSVPSQQLHTVFWKAVNDTLGIEHEYTYFEITNLILEKEPKELDAYFNSLINPPALENVNNDMSVARRGGPETGVPPKGGPPAPPPGPPKGGPPAPAPPPVPPRSSGLSVSTGDPSEKNNNASSTMPSADNNNRNGNFNNLDKTPQVDNATVTLIKSILFAQLRFYEKYLVNNRVPEPGHLRDIYQTIKIIEKKDKKSYDAAIKEYISLTRNRPQGGGRYTLKNRKKINYAF